MKEIYLAFETLGKLFEMLAAGTKKLCGPQSKVAKYLRGLGRLLVIAVIPPLLPAILGITLDGWQWLTACAGIWSVACLVLLWILATPIGAIADWFAPGRKEGEEIGARYVSWARGAILCQALIFWCFSVIPVRNNLKLVPLCALSIICLFLIVYHKKWETKWMWWMFYGGTLGVILLCMIAFFFPILSLNGIWTWVTTQAKVSVFLEDTALATGSIPVTTILTYSAVIGLIALAIWFSFWLVRKLSHSHSGGGHGGHGGHGGGESHPLKTFAWALLILWGIAVLVGTVRVIMASDFKEQMWGKPAPSISQQTTLNEYKLGGSESIPLGEGNTLFTLNDAEKVCRMVMPTYRYEGWLHHGGNVFMRTEKTQWELYPPDSMKYPGKDAPWIEIKPAESLPIDVTVFIKRL